MKMPLAFTLVFTLLTSSLVRAQTTQAKPGGTPLSPEDTKFVVAASQDGETEVRLGAIAKERGTASDVKAFGAMMAGDHSKANAELKALCSRRGVQLPAELDPDHQKTIDTLAKKSGADFDKDYSSEMVKAHKNAISLFESESKTTKDQELKKFVDSTLPTLRHHLELAEALGKSPGK